jgi:dTDP-4-dehydrorhamnose 3,5-epimerase
MGGLVLEATAIDGLYEVERPRLGDARGFFSRFFDAEIFRRAGWDAPVVQMNHTRTEAAGVVRGMHFQRPPHGEWKYVSCLRGEVFDVAVDLRQGSATFGAWHGAILSEANGRSLLIPEGFAHGFQTLVPECELIYLHSATYAPAAEGGVNALDSSLAIAWPLPIAARSERDVGLPDINQLTGFPG